MPMAGSNLRFFREEEPHLYVIAAGSLLETLIDTHLSFPVGRVEYQYLSPLTFQEFLIALDEKEMVEILKTTPPPAYTHDELLKYFRLYTLIGGMPEAVKKYVETTNILQINPVYKALLTSYLDDVEKYAHGYAFRRVLRHVIRSSFLKRESELNLRVLVNPKILNLV